VWPKKISWVWPKNILGVAQINIFYENVRISFEIYEMKDVMLETAKFKI